MQHPKVAVVTPGSFIIPSPNSSSVERVISRTVPLAGKDLDIRIYGIQGEGITVNGKIGGIPCIRYPRGATYIPSVIRDLQVRPAEIVDVHNRPAAAYAIAKAVPGSKVLLTLHSTTFIREPYVKAEDVPGLLAPLDGMIVNSRYLQEAVAKISPSFRDRISINAPGVHPADFLPRWTPAAEAARHARLQDKGWDQRRIILYVGRLIPGKGVHRLLEVLPRIVQSCPDALLLIAGSSFYGKERITPYAASLYHQAQLVAEHVTFLDYIPHPALAALYQLADVVVVPSVEDEAFGLVNLEAMASGVPVVASRTGGIPEVIRHGQTGWLVASSPQEDELANAIIHSLKDPDTQKHMGMAGLNEVQRHFLWQHSADRWVELVKNAAQK